jgi:quercetin dioxygenase-like cupin family protein
MALQHAVSGERIALSRADDDIANLTSIALVKTEHMELIRLLLPKGKALPEHRVEGEMTLLCLSGELAFDAHGRTTVLHPTEMIFLAGGEPHAVRANEDSVALLTILLGPNRGNNKDREGPTNAPQGQNS